MSLDQNEIQELLALFPNGKHVIERFTQSQESIDALRKLDDKINRLKEELTGLKVKQTQRRTNFLNSVIECLTPFSEPKKNNTDTKKLDFNSPLFSVAPILAVPVLIGDVLKQSGIDISSSDESGLYSQMDTFLAQHGLSQLSADTLVNDDGTLFESKEETKRILLDAWNENLDDSEISILETKISDLQKLRAGLAVQ